MPFDQKITIMIARDGSKDKKKVVDSLSITQDGELYKIQPFVALTTFHKESGRKPRPVRVYLNGQSKSAIDVENPQTIEYSVDVHDLESDEQLDVLQITFDAGGNNQVTRRIFLEDQ